MKQRRKKTGFTLIELLVVIVILGILSTISVGTFRSYFAKARDSERVSTVQNLAMMIKVDSGGMGDCGVYNYTSGGDTTKTSGELCDSQGDLAMLLTDNDYSMPGVKNGLEYYYGFILGDKEGDNEFFVATGAEEDEAQNGQMAGDESIFVDGTVVGIDEGKSCDWGNDNPACNAEVSLHMLASNGAPINMDDPCNIYFTNATCVAESGCDWSGGCLANGHIWLTEESCEATAQGASKWNGLCFTSS